MVCVELPRFSEVMAAYRQRDLGKVYEYLRVITEFPWDGSHDLRELSELVVSAYVDLKRRELDALRER